MTWAYSQGHGALTHNGSPVGYGYSGNGAGLNNHSMEADAGVGPIPCGHWHIDRWDAQHSDKGPCVGVLEPVGHNAHGRSEFLIHGDNSAANHSASHGCIILGPALRHAMRDSNDRELIVTS